MASAEVVEITKIVGPFILGVPMRAWPALLFCIVGTIIVPWVVAIYLLWRIEKSGVKRWAASGKLFKW